MNKLLRFLSAVVLPCFLVACSGVLTSGPEGIDIDRLAPCTGIGSPFENLDFKEWPKTYHKTVADVVEAHLKSLKNTKTEQLQCTAPDYPSVVKPTPDLKNLAEKLPPWKERTKLDRLSEMDIGPVLLEYVRVYECALNERRDELQLRIPAEFASSASAASEADTRMMRVQLNLDMDEQMQTIDHETILARSTLDRTLMIVGGQDRLRPLSLDIECLKRVSLDIRNILGLVSQSVACMPRIQDARSGLRDLPELPPTP